VTPPELTTELVIAPAGILNVNAPALVIIALIPLALTTELANAPLDTLSVNTPAALITPLIYSNGYYNLPNFTSVTFDPNIALQYMKDTDESVLYRFIIPSGFKLLFVESFNEGKKNLLEFILPKNTKVYINKGIIKKDIYDINNICPKLNKTLKILDINVLL
jgi:hypothetical protein